MTIPIIVSAIVNMLNADFVLAGLRWDTLLVYLDDVIVFGRTVSENIERLKEVLARFRNAVWSMGYMAGQRETRTGGS